ncbi:MAG: carboxymuconolactone decarboxylase family protein [Candidatus Glassbacteria bacterium]|nr:carboxymuconolactone decarboxylase family protein [Candidatus Glassbacteria bacterium]
MARVPYLEPEDATGKMGEILGKMKQKNVQILNLYKTLAHASGIGDLVIRRNRILLHGKLPPKLRELAILLVGQIAQAPYEFTKHIVIGLEAGLSRAQVDVLPFWRSANAYDAAERAVLQYTDEVSRSYRASDAAFAELRKHLDDEQVTELTIIIGYYEMICRVLEALQVELEEEPFVPIGN